MCVSCDVPQCVECLASLSCIFCYKGFELCDGYIDSTTN